MKNDGNKVYNEVLEVLKYVPKDEYEKIPKEKLDYYRQNNDETYEYNFDFKDIKISRKACILLVKLYITYIASDEEKSGIYKQLKINSNIVDNEKRLLYNPDEIFKNKNIVKEDMNNQLVEYTGLKWYNKIWNKLKKFINRKEK